MARNPKSPQSQPFFDLIPTPYSLQGPCSPEPASQLNPNTPNYTLCKPHIKINTPYKPLLYSYTELHKPDTSPNASCKPLLPGIRHISRVFHAQDRHSSSAPAAAWKSGTPGRARRPGPGVRDVPPGLIELGGLGFRGLGL